MMPDEGDRRMKFRSIDTGENASVASMDKTVIANSWSLKTLDGYPLLVIRI